MAAYRGLDESSDHFLLNFVILEDGWEWLDEPKRRGREIIEDALVLKHFLKVPGSCGVANWRLSRDT